MNLNLPPRVRAILYVLTLVGTPIVGYLLSKKVIGELEVNLWGAEVMVVSALAAFNVSKKK